MVAAVLEDWRTAPVNEKVRSVLGFLERLTVSPADVGPKDVESMRSAGLNDKAIEEAIYVCFLFSVMDRLADAFGFDMHSPGDFQRGGRMLLSRGYKRLSLPG
jgi:alkylhydroperoxidase family enzyme